MLVIKPIKTLLNALTHITQPLTNRPLSPAVQQALRTSSRAMANIFEPPTSARFVVSNTAKVAENKFLQHFGLGIFASPFVFTVPIITMNGITKSQTGGGLASKQAAVNNIDQQLAQQLAQSLPEAQTVHTTTKASTVNTLKRPIKISHPIHLTINGTTSMRLEK